MITSKKRLPLLIFTSLGLLLTGCSSDVKISDIPDPITNTHTTTVDKARSALAIGGADVYYDSVKQFTIVMPDRLTFNKTGENISSWQKTYLDKLITVLNDPNIESIEISSHFDNTAGIIFAQKYSEQYAYAFHQYISQNGLSNTNTTIVARGTREPISQNETIYGNQANQRIEMLVTLVNPENVQTLEEYEKSQKENSDKKVKREDVGKEIVIPKLPPVKNRL